MGYWSTVGARQNKHRVWVEETPEQEQERQEKEKAMKQEQRLRAEAEIDLAASEDTAKELMEVFEQASEDGVLDQEYFHLVVMVIKFLNRRYHESEDAPGKRTELAARVSDLCETVVTHLQSITCLTRAEQSFLDEALQTRDSLAPTSTMEQLKHKCEAWSPGEIQLFDEITTLAAQVGIGEWMHRHTIAFGDVEFDLHYESVSPEDQQTVVDYISARVW